MDRGIYGFIWRYSKSQQLVITLITVVSFPFLYASLELPKIIVNDAIGGSDFPRDVFSAELDQLTFLLFLCGALLVLLLINGGFLMGVNIYKNTMAERMLRRLRYMMYERILRYPTPHFEKVSQGELSAMIAAETELIRGFISDAIALPLFQGGTLLTILVFMFAQDPVLGAASIALIPLQAYIIPKLQRKINNFNAERVRRARAMSGRVSETVSGIRDIRAHNTSVFSLADFSKYLEKIYWVRYKLYRTKFLMKFINLLLLKMTPLLFYSVGGVLILQGRLTIGALVAALAAYSNLTTPWRELLKYYQRRGDAQIKYQQLVEQFELSTLMNERVLAPDTSEPERMNGELRFDDVTIADEGGTKSLDGVSFGIKPGGRLAIVAGAVGRDVLAHAITRMIHPTEGRIYIGDRPLGDFAARTVGARIGYAGGDSYVFQGTVGYNAIYGLQHRIPIDEVSEEYSREEALASGNCVYDATLDWTDFSAAGCSSPRELEDWWYDVIRAVDLEDTMFQHALNQAPGSCRRDDLPKHILDARRRIAARLDADPELNQLVHRFDFDAYNPGATVRANLIFGQPTDERLSHESFGENAYVREVLRKCDLEECFQEIGLKVARELVDLFGDPDVDPALIERFSFVDTDTLETLRRIVAKVEKGNLAGLGEKDRAQLISLTSRISVERQRLGGIDETFKAEIVKARKVFHQNLPEDLKDGFVIYNPEAFIEGLSIRRNLIMGRNNQKRPNAEQRINQMIHEILSELGMMRDVLCAAMCFDVGIGGQRLPAAARQSLNVARSIIKRPDILVMNDALGSHDRETRDRIRQNIVKLLPETTLIWIDSETPNVSDFDEVVVLRHGRIERRITEHREEVMEEAAAAAEEATPQAVRAEAAALAQVPLFSEMRSPSLRLLAFGSKRVTFDRGETLMRQGDQGNEAYVILSGEVDVILNEGTPQETQVARLGRHQPLGETALLATVPRTATGRAFTKVEALEISKDVFLRLVESDPKVAAKVARIASERLAMTMGQMQEAA
ncbi:MAG: ABC transporter transmembrane domain-containing protein [Methyloligellaceae bacterium]